MPGLASETSDARQRANAIRSDAAVAVTWLNAARDSRAMSSYRRVVSIREDLEELRLKREGVRETFGPDPEVEAAAVRQHEKNKALLRAAVERGDKPPLGLATTFPADRWPGAEKEYGKSLRQIGRLADYLNARLLKYKFHPAVAYARNRLSVAQNLWAGGMVPDVKGRWFQTKLNGWTISEGDAVLSLVRLDLSGELHKVTLCGMCKKRWRVAAKSHYKFCSPECRIAYYAKSPDYHSRKAATQRTYRENKKLSEAAGLA